MKHRWNALVHCSGGSLPETNDEVLPRPIYPPGSVSPGLRDMALLGSLVREADIGGLQNVDFKAAVFWEVLPTLSRV